MSFLFWVILPKETPSEKLISSFILSLEDVNTLWLSASAVFCSHAGIWLGIMNKMPAILAICTSSYWPFSFFFWIPIKYVPTAWPLSLILTPNVAFKFESLVLSSTIITCLSNPKYVSLERRTAIPGFFSILNITLSTPFTFTITFSVTNFTSLPFSSLSIFSLVSTRALLSALLSIPSMPLIFSFSSLRITNCLGSSSGSPFK